MVKKKYLHIFSILFVLSACATNSNQTTVNRSDLVEFNIPEVILQEVEPEFLTKYARSCSYIPLELTKESSIEYIREAYTTDNEIITVDWHACLLFDKQSGKFIRKIGNNGTGPNEYLNIITSAFDEENEIIYILSTGNHAIIGYNLKGEAVHYIPRHDKPLLYIDLIDSLTYAGTISSDAGDGKSRLLIGSFQEETVHIIPKKSSYIRKRADIRGSTGFISGSSYNFETQLYRFNNQLHMKEAWNDTIFQIQHPNILIPEYVFHLGNLKVPEHVRGDTDQLEELFNTKCIGQVRPLETDNYLFFTFWYQNNRYSCVYEKSSKHVALVDKRGHGLYGIQNDLQKGPPFWPAYINQKEEMLTLIYADSFREYQKRSGVKILPDLQEDDNPVIVIVK